MKLLDKATMDRMSLKQLNEFYKEAEALEFVNQKEMYQTNNFMFQRNLLHYDALSNLHMEMLDIVNDFLFKDTVHKGLLVMVSRDCFKSSCVTIGTSMFLLNHNPNLTILFSSYKQDNAAEYLQAVKWHYKDPLFTKYFGDLEGDVWHKNAINLKTRGYTADKEHNIECTGLDGSVTGRHYHLIIHEDLVCRQTNTDVMKKAIKLYAADSFDWLQKVSPYFPTKAGKMIIVGTHWSDDDYYMHVIDNLSSFRKERINPSFMVYFRPAIHEGALIFPERLDYKKLEQLKAEKGTFEFNAQYMLNPIPEAKQKFDERMIKIIDPLSFRSYPYYRFILFDPNVKNEDESTSNDLDYSAMAVVDIVATPKDPTLAHGDGSFKVIVQDLVRERMGHNEQVDNLINLYNRWGARKLSIEGVQYQYVLKPIMEARFKELGIRCPVVNPKKNYSVGKKQRIKSLMPFSQRGDFYVSQNCGYMDELFDEIRRFPSSPHYDIMDSIAQITDPNVMEVPTYHNPTYDIHETYRANQDRMVGRDEITGW